MSLPSLRNLGTDVLLILLLEGPLVKAKLLDRMNQNSPRYNITPIRKDSDSDWSKQLERAYQQLIERGFVKETLT